MAPKYINSAGDLVTTHDATRQGFINQAVAKGKAAAPYIIRAREFRDALKSARNIKDISKLSKFKLDLATAAGLSTKGVRHLTAEELEKIVAASLKAASIEEDFRQELVDRYLLTKGDALGGSMRNWIGASASERLVSFLIQALKKKKITPVITKTKKGKIQSLQWGARLLRFDYKPKFVGKNIDVILVEIPAKVAIKDVLITSKHFIAAGELKGGIDPAGADEHWKTANSALERIRTRFKKEKKQPPHLFFVGAAIETAMAVEIFEQLNKRLLTHAANLNSEKQLTDLADWLTTL